MRVDQDRLVFIALGVLELWRERIRKGPATPDFGLRLALAVLFSFSRSGNRERYDQFWRNVSDPHAGAFSQCQGDHARMQEAHTCIEGIITDVGASRDMKYLSKLHDAVFGPPPHTRRPGSAYAKPASEGEG